MSAKGWIFVVVVVLGLGILLSALFRGCRSDSQGDSDADLQKEISSLRAQLAKAKADAKRASSPLVVANVGVNSNCVSFGPACPASPVACDTAASDRVKIEELQKHIKMLQEKIRDTNDSLTLAKIRANSDCGYPDLQDSWKWTVRRIAGDLDYLNTQLAINERRLREATAN